MNTVQQLLFFLSAAQFAATSDVMRYKVFHAEGYLVPCNLRLAQCFIETARFYFDGKESLKGRRWP